MRISSVRFAGTFAALALFASPALGDDYTVTKKRVVPADNRLPGHEPDTYRFGLPYNTMRGSTPGQCEVLCNRDDSCAAWSLVPATFQTGPRCELKRSIGSAEYRPGAVSGIAVKYQPSSPVRQQSYSQPARVTSSGQRIIAPQPSMTYRPTKPATQTAAPRPVQPVPVTRVEPRAPIRPAPRPAPVRTPAPVTRPAPVSRPAPTIRPGEPVLLGGPKMTEAERQAVRDATAAPRPAATAPKPVKPAASTLQTVKQPQPVARPAQSSQNTRVAATPRPAGPPPPTQPVPQFQMSPQTSTPAPQPAPRPAPTPVTQNTPAQATAPSATGGVQIDPPPPQVRARRPWTERSNGDPDYSVQDMDFIPGDEEATAGFVDGLPDE